MNVNEAVVGPVCFLTKVVFNFWVHGIFSRSKNFSFFPESSQNIWEKNFPYGLLGYTDRLQDPENFVNDTFYSGLYSSYTLGTENNEFNDLLITAMTTEQGLVKMKVWKLHLIGIENYQCLKKLWKHEKKVSFKVFLHRCINKDVNSSLEA